MIKKYKIKLPPNLTYDIKDLTLLHNNQTNHISLESSSLPQEILSNLLTKYTHNTIQDYITFLQLNLQSLLDGKETKNKEIFYDGPLNIKLIAVIKHFLLIELTKFILLIKCIKCNKINKCKSNEEYLCVCKEIIQINYKSKLINNPMVGYLMIKKGSFINFIDLFYEGICFCDRKIKFINSFEERCICKNLNVFKPENLEYLENKKKERIECVHYKESCRMFVFPCCKNVYSCPKCHDKNEGHKFEYAYQMICLVCNKRVSVKDVCDCGYVHIKKKSVFWEGGKGKRDKVTMSKKDSKKYK